MSAEPRPTDTPQHATDTSRWRPATLPVTLGRPAREPQAPANHPIELTSTYVSTGPVEPADLLYARYDSRAYRPLEETLGALEGAALPGVAFASGMAAIDAALALLASGDRVVVPRHAYLGTLGLLDELAARLGLMVVRVDIADTDAVVAALAAAPTAMLWAESPTNPMLEVADLPAILAAATSAGALSVVDNTFATPLGQRPLTHGADIVVHSATKYLAGHSDVVMGAAITGRPELRERLVNHRKLHGSIPGPFECFLTLRGIRTLAVRLDRAQSNAAKLAARLARHPNVGLVRHPSLARDPGHERAARFMTGFGAVIGVDVAGDGAAADRVIGALRLWLPATSLGGVESLAERRRRYPGEAVTVPENLIRLAVGIEDVEDLWEDLDQALRHAAVSRTRH